jgi:hypothetical protein
MNRPPPVCSLCLFVIGGCAGAREGGFGIGIGYDPPTNSQICNTHIRRVATSMLLYSGDNNDLFPPANWDSATDSYFDSKYHSICPTLEKAGLPDSGFAMNADLVSWPTTAIEEPSTTPLVFETAALGRNRTGLYSSRITASRHNGTIWKANADTSVYESLP